ncbi:Gfo/Idh/MocA family protein [Sphingobacterium griseoflavum]|uniref:Dehydrogenase n=1 Tax=Sphingobacterium griseoflavum TaxID=1474952 RepID=A0ABQ3I241_9SPHI|nr:Gfo/Idh/MocA family oxidoreductase [Sphingobacterium griseoflavum]GHE42556.1 dehydrogenase [Sphingobacterium griseoflavum]
MEFNNFSAEVRVGAIGIKGMGWHNLEAILKVDSVRCTAICDIDDTVLEQRSKQLAERGMQPKQYKDFNELLADAEVDVVIIATPDHWHCLQAIAAIKAGKDVYVEKPLANSILECDALVRAANNSDRIVQVGQWQRSQRHFQDAVSFVHSGKLGKIRTVKAWAYLGWKQRVPEKPDGPVPAGVDYLLWQGPAERHSFNPNRFHYDFRWYWDYAGGLMTDWGVHLLDYALLGMKASVPKSVMATGGKFAYPEDAGDTPDTLTAVYEFDGFNIVWEHATSISNGPYGREHGIAFIGDMGTLVLDRGGWEVIAEKDRMASVPLHPREDDGLALHMLNFVDAVRRRAPEIIRAPVAEAAHIAKLSHMGNIAYRTGQKLIWNEKKGRFSEKAANNLLAASYHNGYKFPKL